MQEMVLLSVRLTMYFRYVLPVLDMLILRDTNNWVPVPTHENGILNPKPCRCTHLLLVELM